MSDFIPAKDLAKILPYSVRYLNEKVSHRNDFPKPYRVGMRKFFRRSEVEAWWETRRQGEVK